MTQPHAVTDRTPRCPVCGLAANRISERELSPHIVTGFYVCPREHPWETRWAKEE